MRRIVEHNHRVGMLFIMARKASRILRLDAILVRIRSRRPAKKRRFRPKRHVVRVSYESMNGNLQLPSSRPEGARTAIPLASNTPVECFPGLLLGMIDALRHTRELGGLCRLEQQ